jgi:undecaprenyl-diphosphatase
MDFVQAVLLAIVEGITEFLPISSTGHMIILSSLLGIAADPFTKTFTIAIQLGAILSVVVLYRKRFFQSVNFYLKLFIAFLPAAVVGFLLNDYIDALLERVDVVAVMLILGGVLFLFIDRYFSKNETEGGTEINHSTALKIGFFQVISILAPGISRSAATIIGGLSQKLTKKAAAEFSFFLAVPTMFAATAYKLLKFFKSGNSFGAHEWQLLLVGNAIAFAVALLAINTFIGFITKNGFKAFGYYRIVVGILILILTLFGVKLSIV